ncbi:MAG TPA: hypothetical protein VN426_04265 [Syntrophomonadaceae bacterium]|nr:hypothetical protein [Syntrophomonadaceae bacterium]
MNCLDQGRLLLFADKTLSSSEMSDIEAHLQVCSGCKCRLQELQADLEYAQSVLRPWQEKASQVSVPDEGLVWKRINHSLVSRKRGRDSMRIKKLAVACSLVLALGLVLIVPSWRAVAGNLLQIFRADKVESISLTPQDFNQIQQALAKGSKNIELKNFGKIESSGEATNIELNRSQLSTLPYTARLPEGFNSSSDKMYLEKASQIQITPQVDKINEFLSALGSQQMLPQGLAGKAFTLKIGDMLSIVSSNYFLMQGPTPVVEAPDGVDANQLVQAMLALPIWPENVKQQMEAVQDWQHTLIVPGEQPEKVDINGAQGILTREGNQTALVWQDHGMLYLLMEQSGSNADLLPIARSLR